MVLSIILWIIVSYMIKTVVKYEINLISFIYVHNWYKFHQIEKFPVNFENMYMNHDYLYAKSIFADEIYMIIIRFIY